MLLKDDDKEESENDENEGCDDLQTYLQDRSSNLGDSPKNRKQYNKENQFHKSLNLSAKRRRS